MLFQGYAQVGTLGRKATFTFIVHGSELLLEHLDLLAPLFSFTLSSKTQLLLLPRMFRCLPHCARARRNVGARVVRSLRFEPGFCMRAGAHARDMSN
jgi:hypothetical protein